jgi:hypothetical protein
MIKLPISIKRILVIFAVIAVLCLGGVFFLKSPLFRVEFVTKETHLEIGDTLSQNPADYLDGEDWCVSLSYVDINSVKKTKVGRYPIYIYHGLYKYICYVNVTDTLAPVVSCDVKNKTISPGETVSVDTLGLHIQDHSDIDSIAFTKISSSHFYADLPEENMKEMREAYLKGLEMYAEEFQFSYGGIYTLTIEVSDIFHNSTEITLNLTVEQPPVITAPNHIYVASAQPVNYLDYIDAWDFIDEDFSKDDLVIDTSEVNMSKAGTYKVYYTGTDSYGLSLTAYSLVHVNSQEALQEMINTHEISIEKDIIIGAKNPYDIGFYKEKSLSDIQELMLPTIVHLENDKLDTFGSGFIIEINDEFVTIATNEHVINSDIIIDVTFFDAATCLGSVVASNAREDIAFIRIPVTEEGDSSSLDDDYVKTLRTVHINKDYWDKLANNSNLPFCYNCIESDGHVWMSVEGTILEKSVLRDWNEYTDVSETIISTEPVPGSSGSALYNSEGNLVGMIRGFTDYETYTETVAVPLDRILKYFEMVFKYKIQYQ